MSITDLTKSVRQIVKDYITEKISVTGWTVKVNDAWYEESRQGDYQIYLKAPDDAGRLSETRYEQSQMDKTTSPTKYRTTVFVHTSAPSEDKRFIIDKAFILAFEDTDAQNYVSGIDYMYIVNHTPLDKNKKQNCLSWETIYEIEILW